DRAQDVQVSLGRVVAPGAHLPELERAAEQPAHFLLEWLRPRQVPPTPNDQVSPAPDRQAVVLGVADPTIRTGLAALRAEDATAQVQAQPPIVPQDCIGRARLEAGAATLRAPRLVQQGQAPEAIGERRRIARRVGKGPAALPEALPNDVDHGPSL